MPNFAEFRIKKFEKTNMSTNTLPNILLCLPKADRDTFYKDVYSYVDYIAKSSNKFDLCSRIYQCKSKTDVHIHMLSELTKEYGILGLEFIHFELALLSYDREVSLEKADYALGKIFFIIKQALEHENIAFFKHLGRYYADDSLTLANIHQHFTKQSCSDNSDINLDDAPNGVTALGYFFDHIYIMQQLIRHAYRTKGLVAYLHYPI